MTGARSYHQWSLDAIDALLLLIGGIGLFSALTALGVDSARLRGSAILAGMILLPMGRRAFAGQPPPYRDDASKAVRLAGLVLIALAIVVIAASALLFVMRPPGDEVPPLAFIISGAVGLAILFAGHLVDYTQRER